MPPAIAALTTRFFDASRASRGHLAGLIVLAFLHAAALIVLLATESRLVPQLAFLLSWGFFNFCWMLLLRRPSVAAAISLAFLALLILLSQFKHDVLLMTINFVDLMIIDADTFSFLIKVFPNLGMKVAIALALLLVALILIWHFDPFRVRRRVALLGRCRLSRVPCRPRGRGAKRPVGRVLRGELFLQVHALRRDRGRRPDRAWRAGSGRQDRRPACRSCGRAVHGDEAAAHHHGVRRVELRCARHSGHQAAARLRLALPVERRQAALADGRGGGGPELVHRI